MTPEEFQRRFPGPEPTFEMDAANALGEVADEYSDTVLPVAEYGREMYARGREDAIASMKPLLDAVERVAIAHVSCEEALYSGYGKFTTADHHRRKMCSELTQQWHSMWFLKKAKP